MQVTNLFSGYVGGMLGEHAANPAQNWKAKDCALYLVTALTVRGRTAAQGATATNQLVNISDFFNQQVGLQRHPGDALPTHSRKCHLAFQLSQMCRQGHCNSPAAA